MKFLGVFLLCFCFAIPVSKCANILAVLPLDISSHYRFSQPILRELANRGHQVTVLTPIQDPKPPQNYKEIILPGMKIWDAGEISPGINNTMLTPSTNVFISSQKDLRNRTFILTDFILRSQPMQDFLNRDDLSFDLIICELFHIQPFFMLSHIFKAPIVALSAFGHGHFINQQMGNPYELSFVSHENLILPTKYKFFDRLRNTFWTMVDLMERDMWTTDQDELAKKYFVQKQDLKEETLPSLKDLAKNVSLVLVNSHFSIDTVRPNVPGIIEVGGVHIQAPQKLSTNVKKFLEQASNGAIYISLESDVIKSEVSKEHIQTFKSVFNNNKKERFLWRRCDDLPVKPENLLVEKSLSQIDVLAHKNVKVFITHGGQLNIQDAVSVGVPVVCIPMYGDQFSSCTKVKEAGLAEVLHLEDLNENSISDAIQKILFKPSYKEAALKLSAVFNDKLNPPLYTATYWIEYVLKHKDAPQMKSPALELHWYEYYLVDSLAVIGLSIYYIIWGLNWMFWNVALRKKIPRDDIQHLIDMNKPKAE